jgi:hypothetical protein
MNEMSLRPKFGGGKMRNGRFFRLIPAAVVLFIIFFLYATAHAQEQSSATADASVKVAAPSPKKDWEIGARAAYWFSTVDGDLRIDGNGIQGSTINLKDDLGFENVNMGYVEAFGQFGRHRLTVGYVEADYSGSTNIPREIIAKGQTYPAGSLVEADLKLKILELEYQYDILRIENVLAGLSVGAIAKILYTEGHTSSRAPALGLGGQGNFYAPIPMLGIGVRMGLLADWLEFRGKLTGSNFSGNTFLGADAAFSLTPLPFIDVSCGYRYIQYDYEEDNLLMDITLSGPYIGLAIRY